MNTNYYKRKVIWDMIGNLVRAGKSEATAIRVVEKHYNPARMSLTKIFRKMKKDAADGTLPAELTV